GHAFRDAALTSFLLEHADLESGPNQLVDGERSLARNQVARSVRDDQRRPTHLPSLLALATTSCRLPQSILQARARRRDSLDSRTGAGLVHWPARPAQP